MALLNNFLQEPEFECIFHPAWGKQFVPRSSSGSYQGVRQFILVLEVFRTEDLSAHSLACFTCNLIQLGTIFFLPYYVSCSAKKKKRSQHSYEILWKKSFLARKTTSQIYTTSLFKNCSSLFIPWHLKHAVLFWCYCVNPLYFGACDCGE